MVGAQVRWALSTPKQARKVWGDMVEIDIVYAALADAQDEEERVIIAQGIARLLDLDAFMSAQTSPQIACAWCLAEAHLPLGEGSHGICQRHSDEEEAKWQRARLDRRAEMLVA